MGLHPRWILASRAILFCSPPRRGNERTCEAIPRQCDRYWASMKRHTSVHKAIKIEIAKSKCVKVTEIEIPGAGVRTGDSSLDFLLPAFA